MYRRSTAPARLRVPERGASRAGARDNRLTLLLPAPIFAAARDALAAAEGANATRWAPALALLDGAEVIWCAGIGKSGLVARKMAGTLASLGRRASFLHPVEALHGDSGAVRPGDILVAISQSGHTPEVLRLARELGLPVVALTRPGTPLATLAAATLDTDVPHEAGGTLPVTAFVVATTIGDTLALALGGQVRHPGGYIGAMARPVRDFMLPPPLVAADTPVVDVIARLGLGAVLLEGGGIFTDGDLRRAVGQDPTALHRPVVDFCTRHPVTVGADAPARLAIERMERRASQIAVLPVEEGGRYVGIVRLHDLVRAGLGV